MANASYVAQRCKRSERPYVPFSISLTAYQSPHVVIGLHEQKFNDF